MPVTPDDRDLWGEFGFEVGERADFAGYGQSFTLTAHRFTDATGAFAAFQALRPADAQAAASTASTPSGSLFLHANYLLQLVGQKPHPATFAELYAGLPNVNQSSPPPLAAHLPAKGRVANSERYLLGAVSLARFEPRISKDLAGFERGAEAQTAHYRSRSGEVQLTIFSYPTPQMAIQRLRQFESLPDAATKRSGTLVAVVPEGRNNTVAAGLLKEINYNPRLIWNEYVPKATVQDAAQMILAISVLAAGLIVASVLFGLLFGGWRIVARRFGFHPVSNDFTSLHIGDR